MAREILWTLICLLCCNVGMSAECSDRVSVGEFQDSSFRDGYQVIYRHNQIDMIILVEDYRTKQVICFGDSLTQIRFVLDNVKMLDRSQFPEIYDLWREIADLGYHKKGMVQFFCKEYDSRGDIIREGWYCSFIEDDNDFDFMINPFEIGVHKEFGMHPKEKDLTHTTIEILNNILQAIKDGIYVEEEE